MENMIEIMPADEKDLEEIFKIEKESFKNPWSKESLKTEITDKDKRIFLKALIGEQIVAYAGLWIIIDEGHITRIAVSRPWRNMDIGEKLISALIDAACKRGCKLFSLEVREGNEEAIGLYKKLNFRVAGFRKGYYEEEGADGIIMNLTCPLIILAIETSCDETSAAVLRDGREVLSNIVSSQISIHEAFGGVVPEIASRHHLESINRVVDQALIEAALTFEDLDLIVVTSGPGLVGALLMGLATAKAYAYALDIPLIGVDHMSGHVAANYIEHKKLEPPFTSLIVSGGHTELVQVSDYNQWELIGKTRDDAVGEAFDKVARVLGLPYPGGPNIEEKAKEGDRDKIYFKRAYLERGSYDFSLSGIKTAVLNYYNNEKQKGNIPSIEDISAAFQEAVFEVLVEKSIRAAKEKGTGKLVLAGGVSANQRLKTLLAEACAKEGIDLYYPQAELATDNAAMIGSAGYYKYLDGLEDDLSLDAYPNSSMTEIKNAGN